MKDRFQTIDELEAVLLKIYDKSTAHPEFQDRWRKENPSMGQCVPAALIVQHYFGGEIYKHSKEFHYYNLIGGEVVDLTKNQFPCELNYSKGKKKRPNLRMAKTKERFELLKERTERFLDTRALAATVEIVNLADYPQYLEQCALWVWEEWDKERGRTLDDVVAKCRNSVNRDKVPQMYGALIGEELIGMVSIWFGDGQTGSPPEYPWICSLFVKDEYRGHDIGVKLQKKCLEAVKGFGFKKLYLTTHLKGYYERTGWKLYAKPLIKGQGSLIYEHDLSSEPLKTDSKRD